jgi:hypothetical protein
VSLITSTSKNENQVKKNIFFYLMLWAFMLPIGMLYSQNTKIDSLKVVISKISGVDKFKPLIELVRTYAAIDNRIALASRKRQICWLFNLPIVIES